MSSNKKRRELNRAAVEYDRAKVCSQLAAGNHTMLNIAESILAKENESLRAEIDSLRIDVERLDWMQSMQQAVWRLESETWVPRTDGTNARDKRFKFEGWCLMNADNVFPTIREAIDAAIAAAPKKEKNDA